MPVLILTLLILLPATVAVAWIWRGSSLAAQRITQPASAPVVADPAAYGLTGWEDVRLQAEGLQLASTFVPPSEEGHGATLILLHGYGGDRSKLYGEAAVLQRHGFGALAVDLRGHGDSDPAPSTWGYSETAEVAAALAYLQARPDVDPARIGVLGKSMGGATAVRAAALLPEIRAVVAMSAYTDFAGNLPSITRRVGRAPEAFAPIVLFMSERMAGVPLRQVRPIDDLAQLAGRPILFIHGGQDNMVDVEHSRRMYAVAAEPKNILVVPDAGHLDILGRDPEGFEAQLIAFLRQYLAG